MCLVPVQLGLSHPATSEPNERDALHLASTAFSSAVIVTAVAPFGEPQVHLVTIEYLDPDGVTEDRLHRKGDKHGHSSRRRGAVTLRVMLNDKI